MNHRFSVCRTVILGLAVILLAGHATADVEERASFDSSRLTVRNLIGEVRIEGHDGDDFDVEVHVRGKDAREGLIRLDSSDDELRIVFPDGESDYVYPELGSNSTRIKTGDGWIASLLGTGRINVRGSGSGLELWADVTVRVPAGTTLEVENAVGEILAKGVDAELELSTRSGDVSLERTGGEVAVATGSGDVSALEVRGGRVEVATGSGDVEVAHCETDGLQIATGSGDIELEDIRGGRAQLATGSGDVAVDSADLDRVEIGTGSGDVELDLTHVGIGDYNVGTGSGDITLTMPPGASVDVHAETDHGSIEVEVSDADFRTKEEDEVRFSVGGGGANVELGSGGGDIRIRG